MNHGVIKKRERLGSFMKNNQCYVLFSETAPKSSADGQYNYRVNKNFYYLTGITRENFALVMKKKDDKVTCKLYIEASNYDVEKWYGRKMSKEKAVEISGIEDIGYIDQLKGDLVRDIYNNEIENIGFDLEKMSWDEPDTYAQKFARAFHQRFFYVPMTSIHPHFVTMRMIKTEEEIDHIKHAIQDTKVGIESILKNIQPGLYEYQIQGYFDSAIRHLGAKRNSFQTIAASGKDATILHYVENEKKVEEGTLILLDLGSEYKEYCSDISRTFPVNGKFTERQKAIYDVVLKAQEETIKIMKAGTPFNALNERCKEVLTEGLKSLGILEDEKELSKYYYHGVGHHLGLDTHDIANRSIALKAGMVLTCEPGLYIAEENIGIRIEDDILVTEGEPVNLSKDIIKTTEEIEAFIKEHSKA